MTIGPPPDSIKKQGVMKRRVNNTFFFAEPSHLRNQVAFGSGFDFAVYRKGDT